MTTGQSKYLDVYNQYGLPIVNTWSSMSQGIFNHYHNAMVNAMPRVILNDDEPTLIDYSQKVTELTQKLAEMDNTIVQLKQDNATLIDVNKDLAVTLSAEKDKNAADLQVKMKQIADLSAKNDAAMTSLADLKSQLDAALAANATAATDAKKAAFAVAFDMCVKLAAKGEIDNALAAATVIRSVFMEDL